MSTSQIHFPLSRHGKGFHGAPGPGRGKKDEDSRSKTVGQCLPKLLACFHIHNQMGEGDQKDNRFLWAQNTSTFATVTDSNDP